MAGYRNRPHTLSRQRSSRSSLNCTRKTLRECTTALSQVPEGDGSATLEKALSIVNAYAVAYGNAQVRPETVPAFDDSDRAYLAVNLPLR